MRLTVIGTGYVGLVAGAGYAEFGNEVTCVDIDDQRVAALTRGEMPIYEPGLRDVVIRNVRQGRLAFSTNTIESVAGADIVCLAVNTPAAANGDADLSRVLAAVDSIASGLTGPCVVLIKSTVPVGTGDRVEGILHQRCAHRTAVVSNPEFLKEGDALNDFMKPARIVIGLQESGHRELLERLYSPFVRTNNRLLFMDRRSAELTKYAANAMLATRISFMNELSHLSSAIDADIECVRRGLGADPRIGNKFLYAGAGYGGSCFPKDLRALIQTGFDHDIKLGIVRAVERANVRQKRFLGQMVRNHFGSQLQGKRIAVWGLSFKPKTDDVRESPALEVIHMLSTAGASVCAYDPQAMKQAQEVMVDSIEFATDSYAAARGADAVVLVTEWSCFRRPNFDRLRECMNGRVLFDGRNIWNPAEVRAHGFAYLGVGRAGSQARYHEEH